MATTRKPFPDHFQPGGRMYEYKFGDDEPVRSPKTDPWKVAAIVLAVLLLLVVTAWGLTSVFGGGNSTAKTVPAAGSAGNTATNWPNPVTVSQNSDGLAVYSCANGLTPQDISIGQVTSAGTSMHLTQLNGVSGQSSVTLSGNIQPGVALEAIIIHSSGPGTASGEGADGVLLAHAGPRGQIDQTIPTTPNVYSGMVGIYGISGVTMCLFDPHRIIP